MDEAKRLVQASWWEGLEPAHWWVELGLVFLVVDRDVSGSIVCQTAVCSGQLEAACLLMGGAVFPLWWLFGLRHPRIGADHLLGGGQVQEGSCQGLQPPVSLSSW